MNHVMTLIMILPTIIICIWLYKSHKEEVAKKAFNAESVNENPNVLASFKIGEMKEGTLNCEIKFNPHVATKFRKEQEERGQPFQELTVDVLLNQKAGFTKTIDSPEFRKLADKWQLAPTLELEQIYREMVEFINKKIDESANQGPLSIETIVPVKEKTAAWIDGDPMNHTKY